MTTTTTTGATGSTYSGSDRVREALYRMVECVRKRYTENVEFEMRLGMFTSENDFEPGFRYEHREVLARLRQRLENNTKDPRTSSHWKLVEPMYMMMRCEYENGVRKTCRSRGDKTASQDTEEYMIKRRIGKADILSDRPYHFRASVSRETKLHITPAHHLYKAVTQNPPKSVRYIQRVSFLETVPAVPGVLLGTEHNAPFTFQWDISKVSESGNTKKQATEGQCTYHCEFELGNKLVAVEDKEQERQLNQLLVELVLARMRALAGSYTIEKGHFTSGTTAPVTATAAPSKDRQEGVICSSSVAAAVVPPLVNNYLPLQPAQFALLVQDV